MAGAGAGRDRSRVLGGGGSVVSHPYCPNSVSGHAQNDGSGLCCWCERRVDPPVPRPLLQGWRTEMDAEYRRHFDPDYGTDPLDF